VAPSSLPTVDPGVDAEARRDPHYGSVAEPSVDHAVFAHRDLNRLSAFKQAVLRAPDLPFAEHIWRAFSDGFGINNHDPMYIATWKRKRPSDRRLVGVFVSILRRVAPEMLSIARAEATGLVTQMQAEAIEVIHQITVNPFVAAQDGSQVRLRAALALLEMSGVYNPKGATVAIQNNIHQGTGGGGAGGITEEAMREIEAARAQLYQQLEGDGGADAGSAVFGVDDAASAALARGEGLNG
jgi:hypothetical protein